MSMLIYIALMIMCVMTFSLEELDMGIPICIVVRHSPEVLALHTLLANMLYHQRDVGKYDITVIVHRDSWRFFSSEADKLQLIPGRVTALEEISLFRHENKFLVAYEYMLRTTASHFMYIDPSTLLLTSLDSMYASFVDALMPPNWIAVSTSSTPALLSDDYCQEVATILYTDFFYRRAKCNISLHIALVDLSQVSRHHFTMDAIDLSTLEGFKYNPGFYFVPDAEDIQRRWITDTSAFAILPCQWSSYEGCPPSASGAMHPDVTPSAIYTPYHSIMSHYQNTLLQNTRRIISSCVRGFYRKHLSSFDTEFASDKPAAALLSIISPLMRSLPAGVVMDVGASVGTFIERIGVMDHFEYHLFEPSPPHYSMLERKYSNYSNIHITTKALSHSNHSGTQSFFFNPLEATSGRLLSSAMFTQKDSGSDISEVVVPVITLDDYWKTVSKTHKTSQPYEITLLKTDTEGYDTLVLLGGENTLKKTGMVIFECHLLEDAEQGGPGTTHYQVSIYLEKLGFRVFKIGKSSLLEFGSGMYHPLIDIAKGWSNCLALKSGHPWESEIFSHYELINC